MRKNLAHLLQVLGVPIFFGGWFLYFAFFWSRAISFDQAGNLIANHVNIWGDWAAHFTMGLSFAYRDLWLTDSPLLLGARFSYPFVTDWISGFMVKMGMDFVSAFTVPSFLFSCGLVVALFHFFKTLFKSRKIAVIASLIFLLNGGLGFSYFIQDIIQSPQPLTTLLAPPHEYTRIDDQGIKWISIIDSMVIPQRAFLLGFPLALLALALIYQSIFEPQKKHSRSHSKLILAGVILGCMPLIHMHSFLAAGVILTFWMASDLLAHHKKWQSRLLNWMIVGATSLALAIPIFTYFFADQVGGFITWYPGWLATEFEMNWLVFWFRNWAFTPLLAGISYYVWLKTKTHFQSQKFSQALIWLPFFILFIAANLWLFQPFSWDNTKLIVWSSIGFSGLIAYLFVTKANTLIGKSIVVLLFLVTIASGTIDAYRILRTELHDYQMYSAEELNLAEWVRKETPKEAVWLTGTYHNEWVFNLTGRQAVMTYPGWLWTHGYDFSSTERDVEYLYQYPDSKELIKKYGISYVVVGPQEKMHLQANKAEWQKWYPEIKTTANYSIFQVN